MYVVKCGKVFVEIYMFEINQGNHFSENKSYRRFPRGMNSLSLSLMMQHGAAGNQYKALRLCYMIFCTWQNVTRVPAEAH